MDLRQLKYFHAVAKYESLTAASEALNVTQPAVGQQIRKLEESLGLKLLFRHSRGMRLSPVGKILFGVLKKFCIWWSARNANSSTSK